MDEFMQTIESEVTSWFGITVHAHHQGGREFKLGNKEIGHIHRQGMLDVQFSKRVREQLVRENWLLPHHILSDTGWGTLYLRRSSQPIYDAIRLLRLAYATLIYQNSLQASNNQDKFLGELNLLGVSQELKKIVLGLNAS